MNYDRLFFSVLCALLVYHWITSPWGSSPGDAPVIAYYGAVPGDGAHTVLYGADVTSQVVHWVRRNYRSNDPDELGELEGCTVIDSRNWSCPTGGTSTVSLFPPGSIRAVNGSYEVTDTKDYRVPESRLAWQLARDLPSIASVFGAT
jgi:hypothetical protein